MSKIHQAGLQLLKSFGWVQVQLSAVGVELAPLCTAISCHTLYINPCLQVQSDYVNDVPVFAFTTRKGRLLQLQWQVLQQSSASS